MDKKPLIGVSILAVVLLVLGSLSNVVGYQSVKSTSMNDSPLFSIRTKKATANEDNGVITSDYLCKGLNTIQFPLRDNKTAMIQNFLSRIRTMDKDTFDNFITMIIRTIQKEPKVYNVNNQEILAILYRLKNTQNILLNKDIDLNDKTQATSDMRIPICDLLNLFFWIFALLYLYFGYLILTILRFGSCYDSFLGTCLLISK